ncbi:MAG: DUF5908 family protein [Bacteroidota bacterium]
MAGGIEIRELIFKATVEDPKKETTKATIVKGDAQISRNLRESIITECMQRMKDYLRDNNER